MTERATWMSDLSRRAQLIPMPMPLYFGGGGDLDADEGGRLLLALLLLGGLAWGVAHYAPKDSLLEAIAGLLGAVMLLLAALGLFIAIILGTAALLGKLPRLLRTGFKRGRKR